MNINELMGKLYPPEVRVSEQTYARVEDILTRELDDELDTTYRVRWTYYDQFGEERRGKSPHFRTDEEIVAFVRDQFAEVKPDVWWVERVSTIEAHHYDTETGKEIR